MEVSIFFLAVPLMMITPSLGIIWAFIASYGLSNSIPLEYYAPLYILVLAFGLVYRLIVRPDWS